jgi:hypothetical protein
LGYAKGQSKLTGEALGVERTRGLFRPVEGRVIHTTPSTLRRLQTGFGSQFPRFSLDMSDKETESKW